MPPPLQTEDRKPTKNLSAGSVLLKRLEDLQAQVAGMLQGPANIVQGPIPQPGQTSAAQNLGIADVLQGDILDPLRGAITQAPPGAVEGPIGGFAAPPASAIPPTGDILGLLTAGPNSLTQSLLGVSPAQLGAGIGLTQMDLIQGTGNALASALGLGGTEAEVAAPQFDLQGALAAFGAPPPAGPGIGAGGISAPQPEGAVAPRGFNVLSQILGPAAAIPPPIQEPLPPELDLAPIRAQFLAGQPQGPSEEDLEALQFSHVLQGLGQGGLTGAGAPIGEMLLRVGLGGLSGLGSGIGAREAAEAEAQQAGEGFQRDLAEVDLSILGTEREAEEARRQATVRNMEREREAQLQRGAAGATRFLGMTPQGPAFETTRDGQRVAQVMQLPPTPQDMLSAQADYVSSMAKLTEAEAKIGKTGIVDPAMAGTSAVLVQIGNELAQTGAWTQALPEELRQVVIDTVNEKLQGTPVERMTDDELRDKVFNQALISAIAQAITINPDLIPELARFSTTAAQLSMAGRLSQEPRGGAR